MSKHKAQGRYKVVDTETGELAAAVFRNKPKHAQPFTMIFQDALLDMLAGVKRPSPSELRVLLTVMGLMTYENNFDQPLSVIANVLGVNRTAVSLAMSGLAERGWVKATPRPGRPTEYQVEPALCWRGGPGQRAAARRKSVPVSNEQLPLLLDGMPEAPATAREEAA